MNRYTAREVATFSHDLSNAASRVYAALDEYARDKGVCWPKQKTLAARIGCSVRHLQRCIAELAGAGLCRTERPEPGGRNQYRLVHAFVRNQTTSASSPGDMEVATQATSAAPPLIRNNHGIESEANELRSKTSEPREAPPVCPDLCRSCRGTGTILIQAIGWTTCTPCRGSGQTKTVSIGAKTA